jgi:hypothetical protein
MEGIDDGGGIATAKKRSKPPMQPGPKCDERANGERTFCRNRESLKIKQYQI